MAGNFLSLSYHHHHNNYNYNYDNYYDDDNDDPTLITPHNNNNNIHTQQQQQQQQNFYSTTTNVVLSSLVNQALLIDSSSAETTTTTTKQKQRQHENRKQQQRQQQQQTSCDDDATRTGNNNNNKRKGLLLLFKRLCCSCCCCCCFHEMYKKINKKINNNNKDAFGFALRMSLVLTVSSLFVMISPDDPYRQGSWVYITCCMVSWFPKSMDAASVLKKTFQRIIGTTLGAILALAVGFVTIYIDNVQYQATFIGWSIAVLSFVLPFIVVSFPGIFGGYSYASVLVLMTFGIAVFPFYNKHPDERAWEIGCYRIANVIIGCLLSGIAAMVVMPKSTHEAIRQSVQYQINLAGESSQAVMRSAYEVFSGRRDSIPFKTIIQRQVNNNNNNNNNQQQQQHEQEEGSNNNNNNINKNNEVDIVHKKYAAAIKDFISTKSLFPLLDYDPFFQFCFSSSSYSYSSAGNDDDDSSDDDDEGDEDVVDRKELFKYRAAFTNQRSFRIQSTVILLDSIIRNDNGHKFTIEQLQFFDRVGLLIGKLLKVPFDNVKNCNIYALELCSMLQQIRKYSIDAINDVNYNNSSNNKVARAAKREMETFDNNSNNDHHLGNLTDGGDEEEGGGGGRLMSVVESATNGDVADNDDNDYDEDYLFLEDFVKQLESFDRGQPLFAQSASILFLELVEHLILRSLRLYMTNRNNHDHDMEQLLTSLRKVSNNNNNNNNKEDEGRHGNNNKNNSRRRRLEAYGDAAAAADDDGGGGD